ncbi:MAG: hypothetical protein FWJ62_01815 [Thermaerobacter sp.]|nr:hypothetical protein [Bacillota bacterium]
MSEPLLDDRELAAVVAAVAAYLDQAPGRLQVTAVRPAVQPAAPAPWALAARLHQMDGRRLPASRRNGR